MRVPTSRSWMLGLSSAGLAFSGYLSGVKLFTESCAFNEPCPYFLGYPACWYGFAMFLALFLVSLHAVVKRPAGDRPERMITAIAALGTLFAGGFTVDELTSWLGPQGVQWYSLGLPTCMYGLVFYVALLVLGLRGMRGDTAGVKDAAAPRT